MRDRGAIGVLLAFAGESSAGAIARSFLPYAPSGPIVDVTLLHVVRALAASVALGALAAIYPAVRAASLHPVRAIRGLP